MIAISTSSHQLPTDYRLVFDPDGLASAQGTLENELAADEPLSAMADHVPELAVSEVRHGRQVFARVPCCEDEEAAVDTARSARITWEQVIDRISPPGPTLTWSRWTSRRSDVSGVVGSSASRSATSGRPGHRSGTGDSCPERALLSVGREPNSALSDPRGQLQ